MQLPGHPVNLVPPVDANDAAIDSIRFSMAEADWAEIFVQVGVSAGAVPTLTVEESTDKDGTSKDAIDFLVQKFETASGSANSDVPGDPTQVEATGLALSTTNGIMYRVIVRARELAEDHPYVGIHLTDPGASALVSALAILHGARYGAEVEASVLA